jgi:GT2 family glycosyltransferase
VASTPNPNHLDKVAAEIEAIRSLLSRLRGRIALRRLWSGTADNENAELFRVLDQLGDKLNAISSEARLLRSDLSHLTRRLEDVDRDASEHKAKRADALARVSQRDERLREIEESAVWKSVKPLWKIARHRRKARQEKRRPQEVAFALDWPKEWRTKRDILLVKGWCFSRSGQELAGVRAKIGRKSKIGRYGIERPDIGEIFDGDSSARRSGFTIELRVPPGRSMVTLETITLGGQWEPFYEHELIGEGTGERGARDRQKGDPAKLPRLVGISAKQALELLQSSFAQHEGRVRKGAFFSIITPTFNTNPQWFAEAAISLLDQSCTNWEWCVFDDGSTNRETRRMLEQLATASPRLKIDFGEKSGISAASNSALDRATGEFVCFLDHDDLLDPSALDAIHDAIAEGYDVVYSDEDKLDDKTGKLVEPFHKPDWSPEYFRGAMYVGHLLCVRRELAKRVRFDSAFDGVQDFEFMLRLSETAAKIGHVSDVLYHWRKSAGSIAENTEAKPAIAELQERAVNAHLSRLALPAQAVASRLPHRLEIRPRPRATFPLISILIPTKDAPKILRRCLESIAVKTSYPQVEIVVIDNDSTDEEARRIMHEYGAQVVPFPGKFNFSRANNAGVRQARGQYLVFLNNDTEIVTPNWLEHLLYYSEQADIGAAGALLVYNDRTVQHAGVALGMRGTADHLMRGFPLDVDGYAGSLACAREVSAVTAACMMMRKALFEEVGGFNEHFFTAYQDLDLCLRLRDRGLRIIYTPRTVVVHHEWTSRKTYYDMVDRTLLLDQWEDLIQAGDPYYNRNLELECGDYSLSQRK